MPAPTRLALAAAALVLGTAATFGPAAVALVAMLGLTAIAAKPRARADVPPVTFVLVEPSGVTVTTLGAGAPVNGRELAAAIGRVMGRRR